MGNDLITEQTGPAKDYGPESPSASNGADSFNASKHGGSAGGEPQIINGETVSAYGKFDSLEQLIKGYANLEAEFTKRCQKLKELEKRCETGILSEQEKERYVEEKLSDARFVAERIAADEKISDLIISRYLSSVRRAYTSAPVLNSASGMSALTPVKKPKSLEEAKKLADLLLK